MKLYRNIRNEVQVKYLLLSTLLMLMGCANSVEVPERIKLEAPESMPTTTIRHEIIVSVELKNMFYEECKKELETTDEILLKSCSDAKEYEFIKQMLTLINSGNQQ